jgi:integrase
VATLVTPCISPSPTLGERASPSGDVDAVTPPEMDSVETSDDAAPSFLRPKARRRAYGDRRARALVVALPQQAVAGQSPTVEQAVRAMLNAHALDWSTTFRRGVEATLLSKTGRFRQWCNAEGIETIDQLTTDRLLALLNLLADSKRGPGLKSGTINTYRSHLRSLARFQAETPGYGRTLGDIDRIRLARVPKETLPVALSKDEEAAVVAACPTIRDRLIIETFLATGVRVSEMAALLLSRLFLTAKPPRVQVVGTVHDPDCTKNGHPRVVPFRRAYATLPNRLAAWIATDRDPTRCSPRQELFLSHGEGRRGTPAGSTLTIWGYERLCERISDRAGIHFSPHILRHTWATRLVDAGVKPLHLMQVGGWSSVEMVRRYYTANDQEVLNAIAAASAA